MPRRPSAHVGIVSRRVPKLSGPSPHAVMVARPGATLYIAGILPLEPPSGKACEGPMRRQIDLVMGHLKNLLAESRFALDEVVSTTLYVTELKHMAIVDEVYGKQFVSQALPARTVVQVANVGVDKALVALDAVAIKLADEPPAPPPPPDPYGYDEPMY